MRTDPSTHPIRAATPSSVVRISVITPPVWEEGKSGPEGGPALSNTYGRRISANSGQSGTVRWLVRVFPGTAHSTERDYCFGYVTMSPPASYSRVFPLSVPEYRSPSLVVNCTVLPETAKVPSSSNGMVSATPPVGVNRMFTVSL